MQQTKNKTLRIELSKDIKSSKGLPVSSAESITKNYLNNQTLEFWNNTEENITFDNAFQNQYIGALHCAFNRHYAFTLNPDDIWLLVLQSLSTEVNLNPEKYRGKFVDFEGKKEIEIRHDGLIKGSAYNDWNILFPLFADSIKSYLKDGRISSAILPEFSTTTQIDSICGQIALMDITKSYFTYSVRTMCGIPSIYLEGKKEDWVAIVGSIQEILPTLGLTEWSDKLSIIVCNIIACYDGFINKEFFQNIYKYQQSSGTEKVTGWITDFFPNSVFVSFKKNQNGVYKKLTEIKKSTKFSTSSSTSSLASVPFLWKYLENKYEMSFFSGFCGSQAQNMIQ